MRNLFDLEVNQFREKTEEVGRWFGGWKERLTVGQCVAAAAGVILLMLAISAAKTNWQGLTSWIRYSFSTPRRVSGD